MDMFVQSLKSHVEKASGQISPWGHVNPLVIIGLTESILDLGLTEEQIYQVIRSFARQLAAQVHPDRRPENVSPERQKEILGAFNFLDDRENFANALANFRTIRSDERREIKILSQAVNSLKRQLDEYSSRYKQFALSKKDLDAQRQKYAMLKREEPLVVPIIEAKAEQIEKKLRSEIEVWKERYERLKKDREDLEEKVRSIREPLQKKYGIWRSNREMEISELKTQKALLKRKLGSILRENVSLRIKVNGLIRALDTSQKEKPGLTSFKKTTS